MIRISSIQSVKQLRRGERVVWCKRSADECGSLMEHFLNHFIFVKIIIHCGST